MATAVVLIRTEPSYRRQAFEEGLQRLGFKLRVSADGTRPQLGDVLVTWNRSGHYGMQAEQWERQGGTVLVTENGFVGHDENGVQYYALALHGHNGSGKWPTEGYERWDKLHIELKPWRTHGEHIVVRGQRGIGSSAMASPADWHNRTAQALSRVTARSIVVQTHPGKPANDINVARDICDGLRGAHAMCIWASAAGVRALIEGVPVFYDAPHWICESAALRGVLSGNLENPLMSDDARRVAMRDLAWAQWTVAEIASGEPFERLLKLGGVR